MSRLIDADAFQEFLWNNMDFMVPKGTEKLDQYEIKKLIDAQQTAYDVEKVVDEVRKYDHRCDDCRTFNCSECEFMKLIDAIRKGGVE